MIGSGFNRSAALEESRNLILGIIGGRMALSVPSEAVVCGLVVFLDEINMTILRRLLIEGSGKTWKQDQRVRLQHVDTSGYLHSHDKKYQRIAGGQQEV